MNKFDDMLDMLCEVHGEELTQLIVLDEQCDCLTRAWVVAEIARCQQIARCQRLQKEAEKGSGNKITQRAAVHFPLHLTRDVAARLATIDVRECLAFREQDKRDILAKIADCDVYNRSV